MYFAAHIRHSTIVDMESLPRTPTLNTEGPDADLSSSGSDFSSTASDISATSDLEAMVCSGTRVSPEASYM